MHDTAMLIGQRFFQTYANGASGLKILDLGSQDVNGSLRTVAPPGCEYVGVDFADAKGVDVVLTDPYKLPFEDESFDICVSANCFEHSEFFWLSFLEIVRVLKPEGLFYLDVPFNGAFHRYPVDCWRFYPDSGMALRNWGRRNNYPLELLESFVGNQQRQMMNDFVAVFLKDRTHVAKHPNRIQSSFPDFVNGYVLGATRFTNPLAETPDRKAHLQLKALTASFKQILG
jgi:SAM-dependent methyltransferase